jgi:hypothetical protein
MKSLVIAIAVVAIASACSVKSEKTVERPAPPPTTVVTASPPPPPAVVVTE